MKLAPRTIPWNEVKPLIARGAQVLRQRDDGTYMLWDRDLVTLTTTKRERRLTGRILLCTSNGFSCMKVWGQELNQLKREAERIPRKRAGPRRTKQKAQATK